MKHVSTCNRVWINMTVLSINKETKYKPEESRHAKKDQGCCCKSVRERYGTTPCQNVLRRLFLRRQFWQRRAEANLIMIILFGMSSLMMNGLVILWKDRVRPMGTDQVKARASSSSWTLHRWGEGRHGHTHRVRVWMYVRVLVGIVCRMHATVPMWLVSTIWMRVERGWMSRRRVGSL